MSHLSDSKAQMKAEKLILNGLAQYLGLPNNSLHTKRILVDNTVSVEIDGYNEDNKIMVEVFARIGKLSAAHYEKLANDILKLKLVEDVLGIKHRKYIAVCGEDAEKYLLGTSWKAFASMYYGFEIVRIDLSIDEREMILDAQRNQKEGMKL